MHHPKCLHLQKAQSEARASTRCPPNEEYTGRFPDQNILSFAKRNFSYTEPKRNNILRCTKYLIEIISTASAKAISTLDGIELMARRLCKMAHSRDTICSDT